MTKKKILSFIALVAFVLTMALNVNLSAKNNYLSDITLANVEALAKTDEPCIAIALCDIDPCDFCCEPGDGWKFKSGSCECEKK